MALPERHILIAPAQVFCPKTQKRYDLGWNYRPGDWIICPGCKYTNEKSDRS